MCHTNIVTTSDGGEATRPCLLRDEIIMFGKHKQLIIAVVIVFIIGIVGIIFLRPKAKPPQTETEQTSAQPSPVINLEKWDDPAGFTMEYPERLTIDKHDEDKENYAHVELTSSENPGSIIIWVKDLPKGVSSAQTWVDKDIELSKANVLDTTLGEKEGKKVIVGSDKIIVGTVYDDVLWYIEGNFEQNNDYWKSTFNAIVDNFTFKPLPGEESDSIDSGPVEISVDEEEVVE